MRYSENKEKIQQTINQRGRRSKIFSSISNKLPVRISYLIFVRTKILDLSRIYRGTQFEPSGLQRKILYAMIVNSDKEAVEKWLGCSTRKLNQNSSTIVNKLTQQNRIAKRQR
jgi:hypothetical protein